MALGTRFLGHTIHLLKGQCHSEKIKNANTKENPPTTYHLHAFCPLCSKLHDKLFFSGKAVAKLLKDI